MRVLSIALIILVGCSSRATRIPVETTASFKDADGEYRYCSACALPTPKSLIQDEVVVSPILSVGDAVSSSVTADTVSVIASAVAPILSKEEITYHFELGESSIANLLVELKSPETIESIELYSYTDNIGGLRRNQKISSMRAEFIKNALIKNGIVKEKISVSVKALCCYKNSNETSSLRAENRRVELFINRKGV